MTEEKKVGRDAKGRIMPGFGGRPKGVRNKGLAEIKQLIADCGSAESVGDPKKSRLQRAIEQQWVNAESGDLQALHFLLAYWIGKPREQEKEAQTLDEVIDKLNGLMRRMPNPDHRPPADLIGEVQEKTINGVTDND